ncbi:hypothetical protein D9M71_497060 [compost metagenome]
MLFGAIGLTLAQRQGLWHQQRLAAEAFAGHGHFQALVHDALMGRVHVYQHQTHGVLGKNIDTLELRQGVAQRRNITLAVRQCSGRGLVQRRKEFTVDALRLGSR